MPTNLEATIARNGLVWRNRSQVYVSFPTLPRAFVALERLSDQFRISEYDGYANGRHWIRFDPEPAVVIPDRVPGCDL